MNKSKTKKTKQNKNTKSVILKYITSNLPLECYLCHYVFCEREGSPERVIIIRYIIHNLKKMIWVTLLWIGVLFSGGGGGGGWGR